MKSNSHNGDNEDWMARVRKGQIIKNAQGEWVQNPDYQEPKPKRPKPTPNK